MRRIRKYGEGVLRKKSREVKNIDDKLIKLIESMKKTMIYYKGVGLAAVQIGILKRVFVALNLETNKIITVINPEIVDRNGEEIDMEGCLSFPEIYFSIKRPKKITVKGINEKGEEIIVEGRNLLARCFSHEIDHLNGILIIDYATEEEKKYWEERLKKLTSEK
ncbi:peptide deformylase [bacterium]|nr:peptide deformylase [bacterium]